MPGGRKEFHVEAVVLRGLFLDETRTGRRRKEEKTGLSCADSCNRKSIAERRRRKTKKRREKLQINQSAGALLISVLLTRNSSDCRRSERAGTIDS